jgi:IPT/TIG domain-containing protein
MLNRSTARTVATLLAFAGLTPGCDRTHGSPGGIGPSPVGPLSVTSVAPRIGVLAGSAVTIAGAGFRPGATVTLDGTAAVARVNSGAIIFANTPPHAAGTVDLVVTNPDGERATLAGGYTYSVSPPTPPPPPSAVTAVSPNAGSTGGGDYLTITGNGFRGGRSVIVTLDGTVMAVAFANDTTIRLGRETPAHVAGPVDVVVTNPDGETLTLPGAYTYVPPQSLDFNGTWVGDYVQFTIQNQTLTSISCLSSPILTLSPPVPVVDGEFTFSGEGVAAFGRIVSASFAIGTITMAPCGTIPWDAGKR